MKQKSCLFLIANIFAISVSAQSVGAREALEMRVQEVNSVLPMSVVQGIVYKKTYIDENFVFEINEIDENNIPLGLLVQREREMKNNLLRRYKTDPTLISFAKLVVQCDMNIAVRYVSKQSGKSLRINLLTKELAKCIK